MSLSVVIPSKTASNLLPCLAAVYQHEPAARLLVVDDGVDWDAFTDMLRSRMDLLEPLWSSLNVLSTAQPFGFSRNCNFGIGRAGVDDVVLLNDDALLQTAGGFSAMQRKAQEHPEYGVISATTNLAGNPAQQPRGIGLRDEPRTVAFICVLIPRRTIERIGLLDERFGGRMPNGRIIYGFEDNDYSRRVRNAGLKIGIFDGCYVDHGSLESTFRGSPRAPGNIASAAEIYRAKWGDLN
jgi:GT2 family glycosyltransferase